MEDEENTLFNACTDLVGLKRCEAFPLRLLDSKRPGEWIDASKFCEDVGVGADDLPPELFATWLPDPKGQEGYVVILFYDDESKWSMAAHYNRARLVGSALPNQGPHPNGAVLPTTAGSTSQKPASAVEV